MSSIKEKARHIYYCGNGFAKNEEVDTILEELNNVLGGYWGAGISNGGITWIEPIPMDY